MTEPKLLRKPLPPKVEPELYISRRKDHKEDLGASDEATESKEKHKVDGVQLTVPAKSYPKSFPGSDLGSQALGFIMPSHLPLPDINRDVIIPPQLSGPPSFPMQKNCTPLRMRFLTWAKYRLCLSSEFLLKGFSVVAPLYLPMMQVVHSKPILSRRNYEVITSQLTAEQARQIQNYSTFIFPFNGEFHHVERRKPHRQMMIEKMLEEKDALSFLPVQVPEEEILVPDEEHKKKAKKTVSYAEPEAEPEPEPDIGFAESFISGVGCKPTPSEEDEEKELMAKAKMAVLLCLMHRKTGLSLKAYFLPQLPDLSPLADFLVYLNLSFNCLTVFPKEVFDLKHLEILKLRNNPIKFIPEDIKQMKSLKVLIMSFNLLTALPSGYSSGLN